MVASTLLANITGGRRGGPSPRRRNILGIGFPVGDQRSVALQVSIEDAAAPRDADASDGSPSSRIAHRQRQ